ncbi:LOW QUALITY PROTEIN: centrosomal protein of 192 kDa-like [Haliotis rubra]|uniref:LOW QUALITY PROTEIN: centrosomal protein of 192 kDa-like n=1 Tax=Haliotis rubra TaxID=36100 RepID=UPI001EE5F8DC|nr:LOW QUALITY PROTEIN: centrosomal protein of 192 kDa-like [Haliotis rubra]
MDSQDSLYLGEDFSMVAAQGMRQSIDNQTLGAPPAPVAASTVARDQQRFKELSIVDPRGSFLTSSETSLVNTPRDEYPGMKLSFSGFDQPGGNQSQGLTKQSVNLIEFSKTKHETDRNEDSDEYHGNLSARSSLGILPVEALNDLSASLLPVTLTQANMEKQSSTLPGSFKDSVDSADWSKQYSKDPPIGMSHVVDTVKKRPTDREEPATARRGGTNMCLFNGGGLTEVAETSEMEQSILDVKFEEDELKMLDEDFSDIEVSDLSDEDNESKKPSLFGQTDLSDFLEMERKVNEGSPSLEEDDEHGQGEGQESEEDEILVSSRKSVNDMSVGLDMKYFRPSPVPPLHNTGDGADSYRHQSSYRPDNTGITSGPQSNAVDFSGPSSLSQLRRQYRSGDGSEIDTEDELEAARQSLALDEEDPRARQVPRPGLEGQQDERSQFSMMLRQSAEGDVVSSPVPGDGGGGGDGSSGSESDGQVGSQQNHSLLHRFAHGQVYRQQFDQGDAFPEEARVRPMGDDLLSRDEFASTNGDNNSVAGIDRFSTMEDGQNYLASTLRNDMEDSRLQSRFLAPVGQSMRFSDTISQQVPLNASSFNIEDMFQPGQPNTSQDSGINTATNQDQGPRLDASGFNADDFPEVKDPFAAFNSSMGSFGLNSSVQLHQPGHDSPPDWSDKKTHQPIGGNQSVSSSGLGQSFETGMDRQSMNSARAPSGVMTPYPMMSESKRLLVSGDGKLQGTWVADLAFHKSLMKEACEQKQLLKTEDAKLAETKAAVPESEDFFDIDHGIAMLDADEEEFEKENIFMQDDNMSQAQYRDVIANSTSRWDNFNNDACLRISIGQYWATRTEVLGTLEGDPRHPRPEFGMLVKTPPGNRRPVALIDTSPTPSQPSDMRTAGVGNEDEGDQTLLSEKDSTFTIDEMTTTPKPSSSSMSPVRQQPKQLIPTEGNQKSGCDRLSGSSGQSSRDSDHSITDNSALLTVSAIDSFINKVNSQSNPGDLVSTIMQMSNKNRLKTRTRPVQVLEKRVEDEKAEKRAVEQEIFVEQKQEFSFPTNKAESKSFEKSSPPRKPLRGSRLPIRKGSLASMYEKAWKDRQSTEKDDKPTTEKVVRRRSDTVRRPKSESADQKAGEFPRDKSVLQVKKADSAGMRKCKSSSVLEKPVQVNTDLTIKSAKELQKMMSAGVRTNNQSMGKQEPIKTVPLKQANEKLDKAKKVTPEKKLNNSTNEIVENNDSFQNEWASPRPSLGGDFLEEHLKFQKKGNAQQNLLTSFNGESKKGEKENMSDLSKIRQNENCDNLDDDVDIAGLRSAIMNERRKDRESGNQSMARGKGGPGQQRSKQMINACPMTPPVLQKTESHFRKENIPCYDNRHANAFPAQIHQDHVSVNAGQNDMDGNLSQTSGNCVSSCVKDGYRGEQKAASFTPNVPYSCKTDSGFNGPTAHHIPDGTDYSTVSNYLSIDKQLSRDEMVGTSDIQLVESRGFNVIRDQEVTRNVPKTGSSLYSNNDLSKYSDGVGAKMTCDRSYMSNQLVSKVSSFHADTLDKGLSNHPHQQMTVGHMQRLQGNNNDGPHSGFKPSMPPPEKVPSKKPTLLTGQSLMKTEFAQKHLGKENRVENPHLDDISFMTDDTAARSFLELEPQNLSTMSQVYGSEVPSFFNQMPVYHSTPFHDNMPVYLETNTTVTPANRNAISSTDGSLQCTMMTPRMSRTCIETPSIVTFPDPCCVGISVETTLPLKNPTPRWLQCVIFVKELSLNGRGVDPETHCPFKMKNKLTIEPDSTENIPVMFLPKSPGAYVAQVEVFSQPFLRDGNMIPDGLPATVTLQAISERPMIQVVTEEDSAIHFGVMTWGKSKASSLTLRNVGKSMVPLRLAITASKSWHCFMFDKSQMGNVSLISKSNRPPSPALGKGVVNISLKGYSENGSSMSSEDIKIYCRPPEKQSHSVLAQYPPDEIEARIDIEVDTPIPSLPPVASIRLQATIGVLRLHTPRNMETIHLKCQAGKSAQETIKLKNSGNIKMEVQLSVPQFSDVFRITPEKLLIGPGSYSSVTVSFHPRLDKDVKKYDTIFVMYLLQDGTMYELVLKGEVQPTPHGPFLLSDKSYLAFGGVAIGRAKQQKVTILNNAPQSLKLSVDIRSDTNCFQLQSSLSRTDEKIRRRDIIIQPQEKFPIYMLYAPDSVSPNSGKLVIKPYDLGTKFSIPLSGYGGLSSIALEGVGQSGTDKYFVTIGRISIGNNCLSRVVVTNSGQRSAFVRATPYEDLHCSKNLAPGRVAIDPNEFVLTPGQQKTVVICAQHKEIVAAIAFYHGDEVSRQKYRRGIRRERLSKPLKSVENLGMKDINFDVRYTDEESAVVLSEAKGMADSASDLQLFYSAISKTTLALIGEPSMYDSLPMQTPPQHRTYSSLDMYPTSHPGLQPVTGDMASTDKSPHIEPSRDYGSKYGVSKIYHSQTQPVSTEKDEDWELQPDQLILTLPPRGEEIPSRSFQILNFARRKMNFDLCWPGHCVHVSPKQGTVNSRSTSELRVSPLSSLHDRLDLLPWGGTIQVNCDNQYKLLKLQIRADVSLDRCSDVSLSSTSLVPLTNQSATHSIIIPDMSLDLSNDVKLANTQIKFLNTRIGEHCESLLEFTNTANDPISWNVSSFAPAYVKGVDHSSDVYRVTYAVFQFTEKSGQLKPRETAKVPVVFFPQSSGTFTQYWDVKCKIKSSVAASSLTFKVHLTGEGVEVDKDVRPEKPTSTARHSSASDKGKRSSRDSVKRNSDRPIQLIQSVVHAECDAEQRVTVKVQFQNTSEKAHQIEVIPSQPPFYVKHKTFTIGARKMLKYPVEFKPTLRGSFDGVLVFRIDLGYSVSAQLKGHSN